MLLKAIILLACLLLVVSLFLRPPRAKVTAWIVVASLAALGLLII
jgi:hypothetical protein